MGVSTGRAQGRGCRRSDARDGSPPFPEPGRAPAPPRRRRAPTADARRCRRRGGRRSRPARRRLGPSPWRPASGSWPFYPSGSSWRSFTASTTGPPRAPPPDRDELGSIVAWATVGTAFTVAVARARRPWVRRAWAAPCGSGWRSSCSTPVLRGLARVLWRRVDASPPARCCSARARSSAPRGASSSSSRDIHVRVAGSVALQRRSRRATTPSSQQAMRAGVRRRRCPTA